MVDDLLILYETFRASAYKFNQYLDMVEDRLSKNSELAVIAKQRRFQRGEFNWDKVIALYWEIPYVIYKSGIDRCDELVELFTTGKKYFNLCKEPQVYSGYNQRTD